MSIDAANRCQRHRAIGSGYNAQYDESPPSGTAEFSLPPVDRGKDAWLFLAACFVLEALVWGFPFSFGVFQDYYRTHEPFAGSSKTAVIGTTAMGIMYLDIPIIMAVQRIYPKPTRYAPVAGLLFLCLALAISSFSQNVTHLILTQGVLYAIGGSICYCPCMLYMDEWFVKRKGFAFGLMWAGTGLGGFTIPLLLELFLNKYGFRTTLRIWALAVFILSAPLVWFIKPRLPFSATAHYRPFNLKFLVNRVFGLYQLTNIVQGVGYFLPGIYLPTYARVYLGAGDFPSALTLLVLNVGSVIGCVAMGTLTDRLHVTTCLGIATLGTAIGTFFLWGLGSNLASLYVFCFVYGMFAGCYTSSWPGVMKHISSIGAGSREESGGSSYDPLMVVGLLSAGRGIGNVISGPLSGALLKGMPWQGQAAAGYGSGYGTLIAFTGATAVVGGGSYMFRRIGWM
ncbi:uncharacterized protein TRIVIDRAFT_195286 [Trichoderma virens Gv29-8]|uniref:Major facilitator superfamily (MFS) profile domain-containing protein n=1 Tax=Hypocrea virens (strain Gv29-8 / FGSC 10586) TaxID=413071 RepID=G9N8P4_HYPVG|nr:uncharacterized protein TRIVIDRAFT_195286 [Trichoderma virens Gv29-8]EHK17349.1 hypothetical protein TRIVIDRAFT_195286 [Trichoderma virens Gv29-8]